jgi:hypothetical protein
MKGTCERFSLQSLLLSLPESVTSPGISLSVSELPCSLELDPVVLNLLAPIWLSGRCPLSLSRSMFLRGRKECTSLLQGLYLPYLSGLHGKVSVRCHMIVKALRALHVRPRWWDCRPHLLLPPVSRAKAVILALGVVSRTHITDSLRCFSLTSLSLSCMRSAILRWPAVARQRYRRGAPALGPSIGTVTMAMICPRRWCSKGPSTCWTLFIPRLCAWETPHHAFLFLRSCILQ